MFLKSRCSNCSLSLKTWSSSRPTNTATCTEKTSTSQLKSCGGAGSPLRVSARILEALNHYFISLHVSRIRISLPCFSVHNWTQDAVLRWLKEFVELPQYERNFKEFKVNGNTLPRWAVPWWRCRVSYCRNKAVAFKGQIVTLDCCWHLCTGLQLMSHPSWASTWGFRTRGTSRSSTSKLSMLFCLDHLHVRASPHLSTSPYSFVNFFAYRSTPQASIDFLKRIFYVWSFAWRG